MAKTLEQILGYENLIAVVTDPKGGIPATILPAGFTGLRVPVDGRTVTWVISGNTRKSATLNQYGAPARRVELAPIGENSAVLLPSFESVHHNMAILSQLRNMDNPAIQRRGEQEIDRRTTEFRRRFNNLEIVSILQALAKGIQYFDADGNVLPTSANAVYTVDYKVPAANQTNLGGIIGTTWSNVAAPIMADLQAIQLTALKTSGLPIVHALYGADIISLIMVNTEIAALMASDMGLTSSLRQGVIPNGFGGIPNWHSAAAAGAFFVNKDGTAYDIIASDAIIFTPEPTRDWWEIAEGSFEVPTALVLGATAMEVARNFATVYGMFSYAEITTNPPGIEQYGGHNFLPLLKVPTAIYQADVVL